MTYRKLAGFLLLTALVTGPACAQLNRRAIKQNNYRLMKYRGGKYSFKDKAYQSLSLSLNALNYLGDLSPTASAISTDLSLTRPAFGFSYFGKRGPRFAFEVSYTSGLIKGSDNRSADAGDKVNGIYRYQRNLSFRNHLHELSVVAVFDVIKNYSNFLGRTTTPYILVGGAIFYHNPQAKVPAVDLNGNPFHNAGDWIDLRPLGTEGQTVSLARSDSNYGLRPYSRVQPALLAGAGIRCQVNNWIDVSLEFSYRKTWTDYLDDVSGNYVDLGVFGDNEYARALSYRSNEVVQPTYTYVSERDGRAYSVIPGYGSEATSNMRGNRKNDDDYFVSCLKLSYIVGKGHHRPKSRG